MRIYPTFLFIIFIGSCTDINPSTEIPRKATNDKQEITNTSLVLLGTIQDAGFPQIGCQRACCAEAFTHPEIIREVVSLGLIDGVNKETYLFEATPDIVRQMKRLTGYQKSSEKEIADGIFLTHAHIGHYTGLMYLGKEATNAQNVPVYVMPRMKNYLTNNGPWSQLVARKNIALREMEPQRPVRLSDEIQVTPFLVPHRDEYSETAGYLIEGPNKKALFIPDIDKWEKWEKNILEEIKKVDYAFLDATFFSGKEINNRDISQIPHPFIIESMATFKGLEESDRQKVIFIHFNHTNPVIDRNSEEAQQVILRGFRLGQPNQVFKL